MAQAACTLSASCCATSDIMAEPLVSSHPSRIALRCLRGPNAAGTATAGAPSTAGQKIGSGSVLTYRVKTGFSYKIVTEKKKKNMTNEKLLDMRSKTKSDRMCM